MSYGVPPSRLLGVEPPAAIYFDAALLPHILREPRTPSSTAEKVRARRGSRWPRRKRRWI